MAITMNAMTAISTAPVRDSYSNCAGTFTSTIRATRISPATARPSRGYLMPPKMRWTTDSAVRIGRDEQPAEQIESQAEPVEHHQADEADADQQRIDVEVVGEAARDAAEDAVVATAPEDAGSGWLFGCHAPMVGRAVADYLLGKSPIGP